MPDAYTATKGALKMMVCADCGNDFAGERKNLIAVKGGSVLAVCGNCLVELGRSARGG